jgi:hypothetical protein
MKKSLLIGGQEAVCIKAIYSQQMENGSTAANTNQCSVYYKVEM